MPGHDIIVIGASAGGVETLRKVVKGLPADLPAALFIVLHVPNNGTSVLPRLLSRWGPLPASHALDEQAIEPGHIYVAPPDSHLLVKRGFVRLSRGPRENGHRPAVDPLFRSAARAYGRRVVSVVLSGTLDDGTAGTIAVKERGGVTLAQDPEDAMYAGMPLSAIENVGVDLILPADEIGAALARLAAGPVEEEEEAVDDKLEVETDIVELDPEILHRHTRPGSPSRFTCPECKGVLWEMDDEGYLRFRCRVGHAYSAETLLAEQTDDVEAAMWVALRALEENAALAQQLEARMRRRGHESTATRFAEQAREAEKRAEIIRRALISRSAADPMEPEQGAAGDVPRGGQSDPLSAD